jgi:hypothetical protein
MGCCCSPSRTVRPASTRRCSRSSQQTSTARSRPLRSRPPAADDQPTPSGKAAGERIGGPQRILVDSSRRPSACRGPRRGTPRCRASPRQRMAHQPPTKPTTADPGAVRAFLPTPSHLSAPVDDHRAGRSLRRRPRSTRGGTLEAPGGASRVLATQAFAAAHVVAGRPVTEVRNPRRLIRLRRDGQSALSQYWYTIRSAVTHRGKATCRDVELVALAVIGLHDVLPTPARHLAVGRSQMGRP